MSEEKKSSNLYKYVKTHTNNIGDSRETLEQMLYDGDKGMTIKLFQRKKTGDKDNVLKITIKELGDDKYGVRIKKNDKEEEKEMTMAKLKKYLSEEKNLSFAVNYINKEMEDFRKKLKSQSGGRRRRKTSKKTSRKKSRKTSKRRSRRKSKKASRKKSRKKSRKTSKRKSRKC